jgi:hypothetical protein
LTYFDNLIFFPDTLYLIWIYLITIRYNYYFADDIEILESLKSRKTKKNQPPDSQAEMNITKESSRDPHNKADDLQHLEDDLQMIEQSNSESEKEERMLHNASDDASDASDESEVSFCYT